MREIQHMRPHGNSIQHGIPSSAWLVSTTCDSTLIRPRLDRVAVYVIGGLGTLGSLLATWMTGNAIGSLHLHLTGRSGRTNASSSCLQRQHSHSPHTLLCAERASIDETDGVVEANQTADGLCGPPVGYVLQAGGVLCDATLPNQTVASMLVPCSAKVDGVRNHQSKTCNAPLQAQIMFSSVAALLGSPGQCNYVAANSQLDNYAQAVKTLLVHPC